MTTKPPSSVREFPADSLERIAYGSVDAVPTREPNDRYRLGYHVWRWLKDREGPLEQAIAESGARLEISTAEARTLIVHALTERGIQAQ